MLTISNQNLRDNLYVVCERNPPPEIRVLRMGEGFTISSHIECLLYIQTLVQRKMSLKVGVDSNAR